MHIQCHPHMIYSKITGHVRMRFEEYCVWMLSHLIIDTWHIAWIYRDLAKERIAVENLPVSQTDTYI